MKHGNLSQHVSTAQAARALGVSVSTVKRWVDDGVLPAHKTAGGHRKLLRAEVLALARRGDLPSGDLSAVSGSSSIKGTGGLETAATALHAALIGGEGAEVSAIVHRSYDSGVAIEALADKVIAPALAKVGHGWETTRIDVWEEHRGTQLCAAALYELKDRLETRAERNRPVAIGGTPEGDPYLLATLLTQLVLLDAGWDAINLGPNIPLPSLTKAMRELRPRLIWLSVSYLEDTATFIDAYKHCYRAAEQQGVAVAIGGQALVDAIRSAIPYTTYGDSLSHLAAFARTLHPRTKTPPRGRPRKT